MVARASLARCGRCPLGDCPVVPGDGPPTTDRVIVGQAPADEEVLQGKPFVGKAGGILDDALATALVNRQELYITNAVLCQPPGNKSPPPREAIRACHERLINEVRGRMPVKVLALGKVAIRR